jgi:hypothetical protein
MSSATSIDDGLAAKADGEKAADGGFSVWHFFVLLSLLSASVAVLLAHENSPENLLLISLTIGAGGAAGFALYRMLVPLVSREPEQASQSLSDRLRADLEREKMLALRSIKELEFDRAMGKVSPRDFDEMASRLRARALSLIQRLDDDRSVYQPVIERELQARIRQPSPHSPSVPAPAMPAALRCACGTVNDQDAKFCKQCGTRLEGAEQSR